MTEAQRTFLATGIAVLATLFVAYAVTLNRRVPTLREVNKMTRPVPGGGFIRALYGSMLAARWLVAIIGGVAMFVALWRMEQDANGVAPSVAGLTSTMNLLFTACLALAGYILFLEPLLKLGFPLMARSQGELARALAARMELRRAKRPERSAKDADSKGD
ncbi:hypothetical protein [Propionicimonas sp.]|uniref:hypothetical protein n=1 Tax=Propionicimonas sp. TaxID=1955623 RepID=UPI0039E3C575